jgi:hypothetical protein
LCLPPDPPGIEIDALIEFFDDRGRPALPVTFDRSASGDDGRMWNNEIRSAELRILAGSAVEMRPHVGRQNDVPVDRSRE